MADAGQVRAATASAVLAAVRGTRRRDRAGRRPPTPP